ncbi:BREX-1 system adenine-specific DNA-methyltransferase PglX [Parageobacillus toebii NBRC 107807]|uniref:site-specific DNA-methyltransferase (adenine-specific) n=1 Tax=Parageobacillus toebii NBRC 107807 TaxID=1223503 RepID=A0A6G9J3H9_9BACL|nr:BREX-1 system adenine-specific DNA-methyltransferase PglX [Parageobacillus toebii]MBB3870308.1 hypothetical protein [Parageobacillus toebii NBRC 107807]QIQ33265.1 BREX-1 system adenine-specific DNA-methyltransferase PglX [Parageobacillus toebii NBRC 107807]
MNKSAIKNFAVTARRKLIDGVKQKAYELGITEKEIKEPELFEDGFRINQKFFKKYELKQRQKLIEKIKEKGYEQVIEEVAYTWFNRFIALRFMEVNDYLPTGVRVLSSIDPEKTEPDIISQALEVDLDLDYDIVYRLQDENNTADLYKYLLIRQCNELNKILPIMFEEINDYTELLLPDNLLQEGSVIRDLVTMIDEEDWKEQVEIIGWLYQYYIFEEKDRVIKAKKKYKTHEIPYATQLFTPKWIVQYMVQNSLGRYWIESHPEDRDLISGWDFYLENPSKELDFEEKLAPYINKELKVEDIKCFDPAMGSGHILVYMFDVLYEIYIRCGYSEREIPRLIIENNLYGLDIDKRAYQLAYFSLIMKGLQYNRRFLRDIKQYGLNLNLAYIQESNQLTEEDIVYIAGESQGPNYERTKNFVDIFHNANIYGSLIKVGDFDENFFEERLNFIKNNAPADLFEELIKEKVLDVLPKLIKQAKIMKDTYDVLVTNPPYMGNRYMNDDLSEFMKANYPDNKSDLFAAFIEYSLTKVKENGQIGFLTPYVWMFISSYEKLRNLIVETKTISSLIQLEYNSFEAAVVPVCSFTLRNYKSDVSGEFIRLSDFKGIELQPIKVLEAIENPNVNYRFSNLTSNFSVIPGKPIAYWISDKLLSIFINSDRISEIGDAKQGLATADNDRFLRIWHEVDINRIGFNFTNSTDAKKSKLKWFPYNKGGGYKKWYGNNEYVINWENDGQELRNFKKSVIRSPQYYFKECISWCKVTNISISFRYIPHGYLFDVAGCSIFTEEDLFVLLGSLNSNLINEILKFMSPTMNYEVGQISNLPIIHKGCEDRIRKIAIDCVDVSKKDWDSFETSWDFKKHPLLTYKKAAKTIEQAFNNWAAFAEQQFYKLKENEEELNRIFIEIYGLQDELTPEVDEKDVTIRKADKERDIKSFISYAVGCMFGRYSLDQEGLVYAGGEFDESKYVTFKVDPDNVIPITDDEYFEDDIVSRFVEFVRVTFGEETLEENLDFIADALTRKANETSRQRIRRYFLKEFYKDHVQTYQKRPIYWLFDSGKNDGFKALIYMHRYDEGTVAKVRTDYLHLLQRKYEAEIKRLEMIMDSDVSTREKTEARKKKEKIQKQLLECMQYDQVMAHVANQKISIDLDDGVKVNYAKFQGIKVPQGEGKKPLVMDLLAKI